MNGGGLFGQLVCRLPAAVRANAVDHRWGITWCRATSDVPANKPAAKRSERRGIRPFSLFTRRSRKIYLLVTAFWDGPGNLGMRPGRMLRVDIHCHLLPGIDDGPSSMEE